MAKHWTKEELEQEYGKLKGALFDLQTKLNGKADKGGCTESLRTVYGNLKKAVDGLNLSSYVDGGAAYTTFNNLFKDYETKISNRKTHTEYDTKREPKAYDQTEKNGGWSGKYFDPSLSAIKASGTGAKLELCAGSIVLTIASVKGVGIDASWTLGNLDAAVAKTKMTALKNSVTAAVSLAETIRDRLDVTGTRSDLSRARLDSLRTKVDGLSVYFV